MKIVKLNRKKENFYNYMGKFFGSRIVEKETNDRIYDDDNKEWYIAIENDKAVGFVSIANNKIKNVYAIKEQYLERLLKKVKKDNKILPSRVTKLYLDVYTKCLFNIYEDGGHKNFVIIGE